MLNKRISSDVTQAAIRNLLSNTDITFFGSGSVSRTIIESIAREIELIYQNIDLNISQQRLATASGAFLDIVGDQFGLTRLGGSTGQILAEDKAVRFYVRSGRLSDYLPSSSPTQGRIPSGTTITTRDGVVTYRVPNDVTFPASARSVYVPVVPSNTDIGIRNNVAAGALTVHSLSNQNILVENPIGLVTAREPESDAEFRLRISRHINSRVSGSRSAILEAAFSFPGVSDIRVVPFRFGAGSFELLIVPTGSRVSPNILANIKSAVDAVVPYGIRVGVRGPNVIPIAFVIQLDIKRGELAETKRAATDSVRTALRQYLGNIPMGGQIIINRMRSVIIDAHPGIEDLRILQMTINCKPQVIANYRLREDEVFDLDRKVADPILII